MVTKILFGAAIAFAAAAGVGSPAGADPSPFGTLGCSCSCSPQATAPDAGAPATDQVDQGLKNGLGYLKVAPSPADHS